MLIFVMLGYAVEFVGWCFRRHCGEKYFLRDIWNIIEDWNLELYGNDSVCGPKIRGCSCMIFGIFSIVLEKLSNGDHMPLLTARDVVGCFRIILDFYYN